MCLRSRHDQLLPTTWLATSFHRSQLVAANTNQLWMMRSQVANKSTASTWLIQLIHSFKHVIFSKSIEVQSKRQSWIPCYRFPIIINVNRFLNQVCKTHYKFPDISIRSIRDKDQLDHHQTYIEILSVMLPVPRHPDLSEPNRLELTGPLTS